MDDLNLDKDRYFLATIHRQENIDNDRRLRSTLRGLKTVHSRFRLPVIYPIHPRAKKRLKTLAVNPHPITVIEPLDYLRFLQLESNARLILTDSGGVQEEACVLRVPCVTLRDNTERPETLEVGSNTLAGTNPATIVNKTKLMLNRARRWRNPFGDGKAGQRIVEILRRELQT
jgi:UDP-N-acetylglucosamine 2-epimerase (non-hydrolysing)